MILLVFAFYGMRTKLGLMMELDVKLAPQCMEVGSAGLHTAAAASAGGVVKPSIVGQVYLGGFWKWSEMILQTRSDHSESEEKATLESESRRGIFLNLNS